MAASEAAAAPALERGMPLSELNKTTANVGNWLLKVVHSSMVDYTYQWEGTTKTRMVGTSAAERLYIRDARGLVGAAHRWGVKESLCAFALWTCSHDRLHPSTLT